MTRPLVRRALAASALALSAAALSARAAHAQGAAPRFGYVDVASVMEQVPGRAEAQQAFEREASGIRAELQRLEDSTQTIVAAYQRQQASLTAAQRTARERELQTQIDGYRQRATALQERGARRQQELAAQFESVVRQAIDDVRATGSYAMIFAAGQNSAMLAADKGLDVTDQVTARMRTIAAARPSAASTTRPAAAPVGAPAAAPAGAARPRTPGL